MNATVKQYMTQNPARVNKDDTVVRALLLMDTERFRHLPVVDGQGHVVGMISDRDLRSYMGGTAPSHMEDVRQNALVSTIMHTPAIEIAQDDELKEAARRMLDERVGALAVVHNEKLAGILSYVDILRALIEQE